MICIMYLGVSRKGPSVQGVNFILYDFILQHKWTYKRHMFNSVVHGTSETENINSMIAIKE